MEAHSLLELHFQGIQCPLLAFMGTRHANGVQLYMWANLKQYRNNSCRVTETAELKGIRVKISQHPIVVLTLALLLKKGKQQIAPYTWKGKNYSSFTEVDVGYRCYKEDWMSCSSLTLHFQSVLIYFFTSFFQCLRACYVNAVPLRFVSSALSFYFGSLDMCLIVKHFKDLGNKKKIPWLCSTMDLNYSRFYTS